MSKRERRVEFIENAASEMARMLEIVVANPLSNTVGLSQLIKGSESVIDSVESGEIYRIGVFQLGLRVMTAKMGLKELNKRIIELGV